MCDSTATFTKYSLVWKSKFEPPEVVGRGSETQLQVAQKIKLNNLTGKGLLSL